MQKTRTKKLRYYLKWALWVLLVQIVLVNVSASIYAYKFTHFYDSPVPAQSSQNIFNKTWRLFAGPRFYKLAQEKEPLFPCKNISFRTPDNIPIDAWYSTVDSAKGCIIFFHGIAGNKTCVEKEAAMFRVWGYNVLLVDFRGHGKSGGNTTTFGVKETEEVQKAFEFARVKGNKKVILYGVSFGASVCIKAVSENKFQPAAVIADMPFGTLHNHFQSRARTLGFPSEPFAFLVTMWIGIERGYNGFSQDVAAYAKNVKCPVLVEWGDRDRYVVRDEVEKIYKNLSSVNKKLVMYPGADHQPLLEFDPDAWEIEMQAFLRSLPG